MSFGVTVKRVLKNPRGCSRICQVSFFGLLFLYFCMIFRTPAREANPFCAPNCKTVLPALAVPHCIASCMSFPAIIADKKPLVYASPAPVFATGLIGYGFRCQRFIPSDAYDPSIPSVTTAIFAPILFNAFAHCFD